MKKAKLMLSAIAVVAVVSTAFAFKAAKFSSHVIYTGAKDGGVCTIKTDGGEIVSGTPNVAASTTSLTSGCANVFTDQIPD